MSFREFVDEATNLVRESVKNLGYEIPKTIEWDEPPSKDLGDASFRIGYQLSKIAKKKPYEIASAIASEINQNLYRKQLLVKSAESHPSGFLNFRANRTVLYEKVLKGAVEKNYGARDLGKGSNVLVEHTAVNPNKALHVGHLRNVALGDSMARIFRFTNHRVSVLNYIDDSGLQVADILVGLLYLGFSKDSPGKKYDHYAGDDIYVSVNKKYETEPSLKEKQRKILKAIEDHDPEIFPLAASITDRILGEQLKTCWRFNTFYDLLVYESDIIESKLWQDFFAELKEKQIARLETEGRFQGCWIVTIAGEKEGEDKVLVRSDGTATYVAKDVPFAALKTGLIKDKFGYQKYSEQPNGTQVWRTTSVPGEKSPISWGADKCITVIDVRQARLQRVIRFILEQASKSDFADKYVHLGYSIISLSPKTAAMLSAEPVEPVEGQPEVVTMSGRKGTYINADNVFDLLKQHALEETKKRNPEVTDESWFDLVSEKLAISAIRFSLLKQDLDKMIIFDLEDSLKLIGETGPYMLYTYARANSILAKVGDEPAPSHINVSVIDSETEQNLADLISKFDLFVEKSAKMLAPKWIAHYSFELCEAFNKFYEKNRVIQEPDLERRAARLQLVRAFQNVLKQALDLLGIECLPKI
ncbi:MAG: arginine--tRNA ligase [Nitrososphaerota archaeon]|nr:arginine--tRNA ligase [Nitrososphaerota archaeon]